MRRRRRKPMHYWAARLYDGTVIACFPVRKPTPHVMKRDHLKIGDDGICMGDLRSGEELRDGKNETRTRFQDIIANSLNARRAVRDIALPMLTAMNEEVVAMRKQLDRIENLINEHVRSSS